MDATPTPTSNVQPLHSKEHKKQADTNSGSKQPPEKLDAAPSSVNSKYVLQKYATSKKSFATPKSMISVCLNDAKYPKPPEVNPNT